MDEYKCFRCERKDSEVKLIDAVYQNDIVKICEECAVIEGIPVIRKPTSQQLNNENKPASVRQRLSKMAGLNSRSIERKEELPVLTLDKLRKPKDYKTVLDNRFQQAKTRNRPLNLIDNFNWHIKMARKRNKISRKQLADTIGESENTIKLIEENFLPDDSLRVISKIEQYFNIKLRIDNNPITAETQVSERPAVVLKFDKEASKNITIDDLRRLKEEREKLDKEIEEKEKEENKDEEEPKQSFISRLIWGRKNKKEEKAEDNQEEKTEDEELVNKETELNKD